MIVLDQPAGWENAFFPAVGSRALRSSSARALHCLGHPGIARVQCLAGNLQISKFLAEARPHAGDEFNINAFSDFLWRNGNVPIELLRQEGFRKAGVELRSDQELGREPTRRCLGCRHDLPGSPGGGRRRQAITDPRSHNRL